MQAESIVRRIFGGIGREDFPQPRLDDLAHVDWLEENPRSTDRRTRRQLDEERTGPDKEPDPNHHPSSPIFRKNAFHCGSRFKKRSKRAFFVCHYQYAVWLVFDD